jgi:transposase
MGQEELFEELSERAAPGREGAVGGPRLRAPVRDQVELRVVDLEALVSVDHPVRVIWGYVEQLDLRVLEDAIGSREGTPGHPAIAPRLLLALWLYATSQGVGSARALAKLCERDDAYRWLCGGVSVNYHTLADFRVAHPALLDELLIEHVASLAAAGVVDFDVLGQDGIRVRASAGASSFRRVPTLRKALKKARRLVERIKRETDDDPDASNRRIKAAQERGAAEQKARIEAALAKQAALAAERERRKRKNANQTKKQKEPRASTTDADARVMKMADGGFRPAYNLQIVSAVEQQIVVGVDVETKGSDHGCLKPMIARIKARFARTPRRYLADGGFLNHADITWAADPANGAIKVYCPAPRNKHGTDPYRPRPDDDPVIADWRRRMKSAIGKAIYKRRAIIECLNARGRRYNLRQLTVRGRENVRSVLLWFALANNILQGHRLAAA